MPKIISIIFFYCLLIQNIVADDLYAGLGYGRSGVISENQVNNGASDWAPRLILGSNFGRLGIEFSMAEYQLRDVYESGNDKFDIHLKNFHWLLGIKLAVIPNVLMNFGVNGQNVASYHSSQNPNKILNDNLDKHYVSYFIGGGVFTELFTNTIGRVELNYYRGDLDFGMLAFDFSLVYRYLTF